MPEYRIYTFDSGGSINLPPEIFQSEDDQEAIGKALRAVNCSEVEVWQSGRLIVRLPCWVRQCEAASDAATF
jgi:hypothetical protein